MCDMCTGTQDIVDALAITERVKRWDIYDIADELADIPGMLNRVLDDPGYVHEIRDIVYGLEHRLWAAAERGGIVGPSPEYADG